MMPSHDDDKLLILTMRLLLRFRTLMETLMIRKATDAEYPFAQTHERDVAHSDERFTEVGPLFVADTDSRPDRSMGMKKASVRIQQLLAQIIPVSSKRIL